MIIYTTRVILLKCPISKFILFSNVRNVKLVLMKNAGKTATLSAKFVEKNA